MSASTRRRTSEITAEIVAALMHMPRTPRQLCDYLGINIKHVGQVMEHLKQFHASGVVYVERHTETGEAFFALQPKPFHHSDAPKPAFARRTRGSPRGQGSSQLVQSLHEYRGEQKTTVELAALAGVSHSCMWQRLLRGMSPEAAVALGVSRKRDDPLSQGPRVSVDVGEYLTARGIA